MPQPLYDHIGTGYDKTRRADPYLTDRIIDHLGESKQGPVLDLACGTGNYTSALRNRDLNIIGSDLSSRMLKEAKAKNANLDVVLADVGALPFVDGSFVGAICTLATHHFPTLKAAFQEVFRVLGSGRFVILTATPEQMEGYWLNEYFPVAMRDSIVQMPSLPETERALLSAGFCDFLFEPYEISEDLQDRFLYSGKHSPEEYLDENFRAGISTFSSLADPEEVRSGCEKLEQDISSGRIEEIITSYAHDKGDYLFVIAEISHD